MALLLLALLLLALLLFFLAFAAVQQAANPDRFPGIQHNTAPVSAVVLALGTLAVVGAGRLVRRTGTMRLVTAALAAVVLPAGVAALSRVGPDRPGARGRLRLLRLLTGPPDDRLLGRAYVAPPRPPRAARAVAYGELVGRSVDAGVFPAGWGCPEKTTRCHVPLSRVTVKVSVIGLPASSVAARRALPVSGPMSCSTSRSVILHPRPPLAARIFAASRLDQASSSTPPIRIRPVALRASRAVR
ncbi:hypothetical protein ACF1AB_22510 [Streptomyces sp. NPDC014846]|uniref:hypothetical protein n=1 Tax=Streptomyces sp. NPDC014846 TaxID=3364922 RepID=UPI0037004D6D